jgi:hypothetical protein
MRRVPRPDKSTPVLEQDGKSMSQAWFDYLSYLDARGVLDAPDVDNVTTPITNGQVLVYSSTSKKLKPGAN